MDVLVPAAAAGHRSGRRRGRISRSNLMIMIDRGDYFQIGVVIRKGSIATLRDQGIEMFRQRLRDTAPWLGDRVERLFGPSMTSGC